MYPYVWVGAHYNYTIQQYDTWNDGNKWHRLAPAYHEVMYYIF